MEVTVFQLHKRPSETFENIQDKFLVNNQNDCFALADGTTQSFNSATWAKILTSDFIENPSFIIEEIEALFKSSAEKYTLEKFEFSEKPAVAILQKNKMKKGGTATFFAFKMNSSEEADLISFGDCNSFHICDSKIHFFPFENREDIDKNMDFINSNDLIKGKFEKNKFKIKKMHVALDSTILLCTDALSRLFLEDNSKIHEFLEVNKFEDFHSFCLQHWTNNLLEEDDISAIVIKNCSNHSYEFIHPPDNFIFPKIEQPIFNLESTVNLQNMHKIEEKIKKLDDKIRFLENKFVFHQLMFKWMAILFALISISVLIFKFVKIPANYFFNNKN